MPFRKDIYIYGLTPGEVQDSKICDTQGHRFYYLVPFTVFDYFSHPFLPYVYFLCSLAHLTLKTNGFVS